MNLPVTSVDYSQVSTKEKKSSTLTMVANTWEIERNEREGKGGGGGGGGGGGEGGGGGGGKGKGKKGGG